MKTLQQLLFIILFTSNWFVGAEILLYPFSDVAKEDRFNVLITELRCPKCQNNNLADSNAPLAVDLKDIVYEKVTAGQSDDEIIFYLKERYGDFISYRPPVKPSTWIIWYGPFVLLLLGGFLIFRFVSFRQNNQNEVLQGAVLQGNDVPDQSKDILAKWAEEATSEIDDNSPRSEQENPK